MEYVLRTAIITAMNELELPRADFIVEHPNETAHGDYAANVALVAAKAAGQPPRELAERLKTELEGSVEYVDRVEVAGPGFLNFYLSRDFFATEVGRARELAGQWGQGDAWLGKTVVVEYTDPNPFKEFHIGHLFTNAVGESVARLFMFNSATTKRVNYQGDIGIHVACAVWGLQQAGHTDTDELSAAVLGEAYARGATAYKEDAAAATDIKSINKQLYERSDDTLNALYDHGRHTSLEYFETIYQILGTEFDEYFFESETGPLGAELVRENPEVFPESDGARVFPGEQYGLHTRVVLNQEGLPTYEAKELALPQLKEDRLGHYDHSVIVTANEVTEYFKVLLTALKQLYPALAAKTEHVGHGMVRLASGKMSSRTGDVISALELIEDVSKAARERMAATTTTSEDDTLANDIAIAAIKYDTLRSSISQDSIFDKERALSFEGDSGPYLQYTHARICSVLEKAKSAGVLDQDAVMPAVPYEVERLLYRFPEVIEMALAERAPHHVTGFLTELASAFNTFYAKEPIADPTDPHAAYKAAVADAVRHTLKNGLWVLGIKAPERM